MGQSPPGYTYNTDGKGLPFYQGKIEFGKVYLKPPSTWCIEPKKIAEPNDILISVRAPVGPTNLCNIKCCIGRGLVALRPKDDIESWIIFYFLRLIEPEVSEIGQGSTFSAISKSQIQNLELLLPPSSEQHRIASKIQELMQEVARARTACEKQLEAAKALPAAYLREVFESEESKKWERKRLGEVCKYDSGVWGDEPDGSEYVFPVIRVSDVKPGGKVNYKNAPLRQIPEKYIETHCLREGDLLIFAQQMEHSKWKIALKMGLKSGQTVPLLMQRSIVVVKSSGSHQRVISGRTAIIEGTQGKKIFFSNFLFRIKVDATKAIPFFLWCYLNSTYAHSYVESLVGASTYPNLKPREYMNLLIPLFSPPEQKRIADELKEKMAEAERLRTAIEKQLEIIKALPQAILRKAFRGEL